MNDMKNNIIKTIIAAAMAAGTIVSCDYLDVSDELAGECRNPSRIVDSGGIPDGGPCTAREIDVGVEDYRLSGELVPLVDDSGQTSQLLGGFQCEFCAGVIICHLLYMNFANHSEW